MYIQLNKEGRNRYKRKYFFPKEKDSWVSDYVRWDEYDPRSRSIIKGLPTYSKDIIAEMPWDKMRILCFCPSCGLHFYGLWYLNEKFIVKTGGTYPWSDYYFFTESGIRFSEAKENAKKETAAYEESGTSDKIQAEISEFKKMTHCPLCGGKIVKTQEKEHNGYDCGIGDYAYRGLYPKSAGSKTSAECADKSIATSKRSAVITETNIDAAKISDNISLLQEYIKHVLDTEITIQLLQKRLMCLWDKAHEYTKSYTEQDIKIRAKLAAAEYERINCSPPTIDDVVIENNMPPKPVPPGEEPTKPTLVKVGLFNKKKAQAENEAQMEEYDRKLQKYNEEKSAYAKAQKDWKAAVASYNKARKVALEKLQQEHVDRREAERCAFSEGLKEKKQEILLGISDYALYQEAKKEIHSTEKLLAQTYGCLESLYNCGVIYEKYRDPVALARFYDYFASGRCTTLTGPDGAYNLYESEIRMDLVITKLDVVVNKLEDIKKSQYALYSVMSSMKASLDSLNVTASAMETSVRSIKGGVDKIAENSAFIAHNTAVTAFYAKKNAELTNALGFMIALNG